MRGDWIQRRRRLGMMTMLGLIGLLILVNMIQYYGGLQSFLQGVMLRDAIIKSQDDSNSASSVRKGLFNDNNNNTVSFEKSVFDDQSNNSTGVIVKPNSSETITTLQQPDTQNQSTKTMNIEAGVATNVEQQHASIITSTPDLALYDANNNNNNNDSNKSSLDYYACCGAGHRLLRTANAYHMARSMNFGLRVYWGTCNQTEVYHYLFGPEPVEDLQNVTSLHQRIVFSNEVRGFGKHLRPDGTCRCLSDDDDLKIQSDVQFYTSLRHRFRERRRAPSASTIDDFIQQHFNNASLLLGMHIRAGNNETGDFTITKRGTENVTMWLNNVVGHITSLLQQHQQHQQQQQYASDRTVHRTGPPVLFVATDTPSMFHSLKSAFSNDTLKVVQFSHPLLPTKEGQGVSFGEYGAPTPQGDECLMSWDAIFMDMMLLSHVDVLIAPRFSSFSQSAPLSLVFAKRRAAVKAAQAQGYVSATPLLLPAYCEMDRSAVNMRCYDAYHEWCCNRTMSDQPVVVRFPLEHLFANLSSWMTIIPRSAQCNTNIFRWSCLPFRWDDSSTTKRR